MNDKQSDWTPETVPASFWDLVNRAEGDTQRFQALLASLSREQLSEMYDQYKALAHQLFTDKHLARMGPEVSEDAWMDVANWVVMQGEDFYWDVFEDPERTPSRDRVRGPSFASILVREFADRYGKWI